MSTISGYDSSSISTLFSSLSSRSTSTSTSSNFLNVDLATYASIKSGSYKKLLVSYYEKNSSSTSDSDSTTTTDSTSLTAQKSNATLVKNNATSLEDAADDLDSYSMWEKTTTTDSDGNTTTDYDTDAIYSAVSSFVSGYNSLVSAAGNSADTSILRASANMVKNTSANSDLLESVGITIDSSNKLSIDETKFKSADMTVVKSLFSGSSSYGQTVASKASSISNLAASQLAKLATTGTYSDSGSYNYISGSSLDTYL